MNKTLNFRSDVVFAQLIVLARGIYAVGEKYIYYLNKTGVFLTTAQKANLPTNFEIKITNPSALIIAGRDIHMTQEQKSDLEIIKRKYKNVVDILTYDDIVRRIENILTMLKQT